MVLGLESFWRYQNEVAFVLWSFGSRLCAPVAAPCMYLVAVLINVILNVLDKGCCVLCYEP